MKGLIRFVVRLHWLVLAISLLITIWLGYHAARLGNSFTEVQTFL